MLACETETTRERELIELEECYGAHNYKPLDVILERAEGAWVYDVEGRRYLDFLAAYSAVNQGHCHPAILKAMTEQAQRVTITSRAFRNDQLPLLYRDLHEITGFEMALPMNSGVEAVETALKAARKWGETVKGVTPGEGEIIVCGNNFHGRTISVVGFSSEEQYRAGFGPFPAGFKRIPFGDVAALREAITPTTVAFLVEPVQGEAGIIVPPEGFLREVSAVCKANRVLLMCDEIQSGWGGLASCLPSSMTGFGRTCASWARRFRAGFIRCRRCWQAAKCWGCLGRGIMAARLGESAGVRRRPRGAQSGDRRAPGGTVGGAWGVCPGTAARGSVEQDRRGAGQGPVDRY